MEIQKQRPVKRYALIAAGCIAVFLGVLGIVLPLLPTTPFLLLAGACFMRSSARLYNWLTRHPWLGPYIRNYLKYKAVTRRSKIIGIALLWLVILSSAFIFNRLTWVRILLVLVAIGVTTHLLLLKTLTPAMLEAEKLLAAEADEQGTVT